MNAHLWFGGAAASDTLLVSAMSAAGSRPSTFAPQGEGGGFSALLQKIVQPDSQSAHAENGETVDLAVRLDGLLEKLLADEEWTQEEWDAFAHMLGLLFQPDHATDAKQQSTSERADWLAQKAPELRQLAALLVEQETFPEKGRFAELLTNIRAAERMAEPNERSRAETQSANGRVVPISDEDGQAPARIAAEFAQLMKKLAADAIVTLNALRGDERAAAGNKHDAYMPFRPFIAPVETVKTEDGNTTQRSETVATHRLGWPAAYAQTSSEHAADLNVQRDAVRAFAPLQHADAAAQTSTEKADAPIRPLVGHVLEQNTAAQTQETAKTAAPPQENAARTGYLTVKAENWAEEMSRMLLKLQTYRGDGISEAKIKLVPDHLGNLDVHLKLQNGQLTAQFIADKLAGKEVLESQISMLRTALQNQGIQVEKIEVTHQPAQQHGMFHDQKNQQSFGGFQQKQPQSGEQKWIVDEWTDEPESGGQMARLAHGGVFDATA